MMDCRAGASSVPRPGPRRSRSRVLRGGERQNGETPRRTPSPSFGSPRVLVCVVGHASLLRKTEAVRASERASEATSKSGPRVPDLKGTSRNLKRSPTPAKSIADSFVAARARDDVVHVLSASSLFAPINQNPGPYHGPPDWRPPLVLRESSSSNWLRKASPSNATTTRYSSIKRHI